jgi:hypothetical protein
MPKAQDNQSLPSVPLGSEPVPFTIYRAGAAPEPPAGLQAGGKALWKAVLSENPHIRKASQREVLLQACRARDRADQLAAEIAARGVEVPCANGGTKANSLLTNEAISQNAVVKFLARLGVLDEEPNKRMGRPPNLRPSA